MPQPQAKTPVQPSCSLGQDPSWHCQTLQPVGNNQEWGTGVTLTPSSDTAQGTGHHPVPAVLWTGSHTRLHSFRAGQLEREGANTDTQHGYKLSLLLRNLLHKAGAGRGCCQRQGL